MCCKEFNWLVSEYIHKKFGFSLEQDNDEKSKKNKLKTRFRDFAYRNNCSKEMKSFLNTYRFLCGIIQNFKNFTICFVKFIINFILSIFYGFSIMLKYIKRKIIK